MEVAILAKASTSMLAKLVTKRPQEELLRIIKGRRVVFSLLGGAIMTTSAFSGVLAKGGPISRDSVTKAPKSYTVNGRLTVTDVLRVQKNQSVYGRQYAHGGLQVWKGLSVTSGGVTADTVNVTGALSAASETVSGNLQTGTLQTGIMNGSTLAVTGAATVGGVLNVAGRIEGTGVDGGSGGVTTTGNIAGAGVSASSITDSGALSAGNITTSGSLSAGSGAFGNLQVAGNVNFTNATVTGLNLSSLNLGGASISSLNLGSASSSNSPLGLSANGKTINLNVNANGALTTDNLAVNSGLTVGGPATFANSLTIAGAGGLTASGVQAPNASGNSGPGPLTLAGSTVTVNGNVQNNGNTTLGQGKDLIFSTAQGAATHITAGGDTDVAGQVTVTPPAGQTNSSVTTAQYTFIKPYSTAPNVVVTPVGNPNQNGGAVVPSVWVTLTVSSSSGQYTGFTLNYQVASTDASPSAVRYNYQVIGS